MMIHGVMSVVQGLAAWRRMAFRMRRGAEARRAGDGLRASVAAVMRSILSGSGAAVRLTMSC